MVILSSPLRALPCLLLAILTLSSVTGCIEETREDERPHKVRRRPRVKVSKAEPPSECEMVGAVDGTDFAVGGASYEAALKDLRVKAAARGANYVVLDASGQPRPNMMSVSGRAFSCPAQAAPAESEPCEPQCSPGFTCLRGTCVSACNPPCKAGMRCGANRQCYAIGAPSEPD